MQRIGICTAGVNAADHVHRADLAPDIDCRDVGTGAAERATDLHGFDPASGLDAQRVGRQPRDHSAYQRVTGAAFGVDSLVDDQPSDRLADLDHDRAVGLLVPKRERALQGADAEQCGTLSAIAYISCQDVQAVDHDVAAAYPATGENLHLARGGDGGKPDRAQLVDRAVVVDRPAVRVDLYPQPLHVVVPAKPHAVL